MSSKRERPGIPALARELMHARTGPLTQELVRDPGGFGLGQVPARLEPDATTTLVCGFCSTGCGADDPPQDGEAVNLTPTRDYPVNLGMACPKGWEALTPLRAPDRATRPLLRNAARQAAAGVVGGRARDVRAAASRPSRRSTAPQSRGVSGHRARSPTEEMALLGALAKFGMGMVHGDGNTRQCMATAVVAYKQSFGFDAPPYTYADFEESDVLVFVGANLCIAHPIMWERVCQQSAQARRSSSSIRARPRRRWRRRNTWRSARSPTWRCSTAWRTC